MPHRILNLRRKITIFLCRLYSNRIGLIKCEHRLANRTIARCGRIHCKYDGRHQGEKQGDSVERVHFFLRQTGFIFQLFTVSAKKIRVKPQRFFWTFPIFLRRTRKKNGECPIWDGSDAFYNFEVVS